MPHYVSLVNFTDQGIRNFSDSPKRAKAFEDMMGQLGGSVKDIYWTLGAYDLVVVTEAPDDETATAAAFKVSSQGNVRTTTLRAFDADEIRAIVEKAG
jgi:uncharacterized protein with GYD domain